MRPRQGAFTWKSPDSAGRSGVSITIPLEPFDSGLTYVSQPETTTIRLYDFSLDAPDALAACGRSFDLSAIPQGGSVCLGSRHNPTDIHQITLRHISGALFEATLHLYINFEFEGVGQSTDLFLKAKLMLTNEKEQAEHGSSPNGHPR
jgi:hypothetical protein